MKTNGGRNLIQYWNAHPHVGSYWGFLLGFGCVVNVMDLTERPLSTLFSAAFAGAVSGFGGSIVQEFLPKNLRFLIPISCTSCVVYTQVSKLFFSKEENKSN